MALTSEAIEQAADAALIQACKQRGLTVTNLGPKGTSTRGASVKLDGEAARMLLAPLYDVPGLVVPQGDIEVAQELEERRVVDPERLERLREQVARNPPGSRIAIFAFYIRIDGALRSLVTGVVGSNCKYKTAEEWKHAAETDERNNQPGYGFPRLECLGYVDLSDGSWVAS